MSGEGEGNREVTTMAMDLEQSDFSRAPFHAKIVEVFLLIHLLFHYPVMFGKM